MLDKTAVKACKAAKPPMETAGDILRYRDEHGGFNNVPGCRRQSHIAEMLTFIAENVERTNTPSELKPVVANRLKAVHLVEEIDFEFLTDDERREVKEFRDKCGYLPMFRILRDYLNGPTASRNDLIMAYALHLNKKGDKCYSLADMTGYVDLSRERIRQIIQNYEFPQFLQHSRLWSRYADHSTYYADAGHPAFITASTVELPGLDFAIYADIVSRISMLENINNQYLARKGWTKEIGQWRTRLMRLATLPRTIESRISIEGLAMGGSLDTRLSVVVINQIAPALGIKTEAPDGIILPPNASAE